MRELLTTLVNNWKWRREERRNPLTPHQWIAPRMREVCRQQRVVEQERALRPGAFLHLDSLVDRIKAKISEALPTQTETWHG